MASISSYPNDPGFPAQVLYTVSEYSPKRRPFEWVYSVQGIILLGKELLSTSIFPFESLEDCQQSYKLIYLYPASNLYLL